jgi:uncharacterized membrane protein YfcA
VHRPPTPMSTAAGTIVPDSVAARPVKVRLLRTIVVGLIAGFLSGLFGVGGGILIVPALVLVLGFVQRVAHGTSLAAVLPIAISSLASYATGDKVDWRVGILLAAGAVVGAVLGTHLLQRVPHDALAISFGILLVLTAVRLILDHSDASGRGDIHLGGAALLVAIGLIAGVLAGLLGVGGGIILVPVMVVGFSIPAAIAKGTSLFVVIPTSIMGTWRNRKKGNADLRIAAILGLAGVVSAFVAGKLSIGMSERLSNVLFAALLLAVAARMLWQEFRTRRRGPAQS